ncbi:MAG: oligosaccharide flippase family protein [Betaproteobacteria bacterium]|nr:oligosaccharide flippase family protein [Betaproteobacteria bacterium]
MSLRVNLVANYVGQLYSALIGILLVPLYVEYLGIEAYGLVGFYTALQGWFMLLDAGLTPAIGREAARFNGGAMDVLRLRRVLRSLEGIVIAVGTLGATAIALGAGPIASRWLHPEQRRQEEVAFAVALMGITIALRWIAGLYRAAIGGLEDIVWLSGFSIVIATFRFVLVIPVLLYVGSTPAHFFGYQLVVAVLEVLVLIGQTYRRLPAVQQRVSWSLQPVRDVLPFALSSGLATVVWVLVTQTDKILLSGVIPLTHYAYFTMAVLAASGITVLTSPISGALVPRLTRLGASGDNAGLMRLYRDATQLAALLATPLVLVLAFFPEQVILAWTGKPDMAVNAAPVLRLYAVGNGVLALAALPYYLQIAKGDLSLHTVGNVLFLLLYVPLLFFAAKHFGALGAGYAWIAANVLPFLTWLPLVHRRYLERSHVDWMLRDIASIVWLPSLLALGLHWSVRWPAETLPMAASLLLVYAGLAIAAAANSSTIRNWLRARSE